MYKLLAPSYSVSVNFHPGLAPFLFQIDAADNVVYQENNFAESNAVKVIPADGRTSTLSPLILGVVGFVLDPGGNVFLPVDSLKTVANGYQAVQNLQEIPLATLQGDTFAHAALNTPSLDSPMLTTVQNTGDAPLTIGITEAAPDFRQVAGGEGLPLCATSPLVLAAGAGCDLSQSFIPEHAGPAFEAITLQDDPLNKPAAQQTFQLSGNGVAAQTAPVGSFGNGFAQSGGKLTLNNGVSVADSALELTDGGTFEARSVFTPQRADITAFSTTFDFQLTGSGNAPPQGDGFMFVLQADSPSALGIAGGDLG